MSAAPQDAPEQLQPAATDSSDDEWSAPVKPLAESSHKPPAEVNLDQLDGDERELAGDIVPIVFLLPSGGESNLRRNFVMGHTIADVKAWLEEAIGVRYEMIQLKLNGKTLIDPLSLNDLPFKAKEDNAVEVNY